MPSNSSAIIIPEECTGQAILPLARVKKIIAMDDDVKQVAAHAAFIETKATELFIRFLTEKAHSSATSEKKAYKTIMYRHVANAVSRNDCFEFLSDIVPSTVTAREYKENKARDAKYREAQARKILPLPAGQTTLTGKPADGLEQANGESAAQELDEAEEDVDTPVEPARHEDPMEVDIQMQEQQRRFDQEQYERLLRQQETEQFNRDQEQYRYEQDQQRRQIHDEQYQRYHHHERDNEHLRFEQEQIQQQQQQQSQYSPSPYPAHPQHGGVPHPQQRLQPHPLQPNYEPQPRDMNYTPVQQTNGYYRDVPPSQSSHPQGHPLAPSPQAQYFPNGVHQQYPPENMDRGGARGQYGPPPSQHYSPR